MKRLILAVVTAVTLGAAAAPAMAQPGYWHHGWHHHWRHGWYGPGPGYWHHRHFCRWHPYRCGW